MSIYDASRLISPRTAQYANAAPVGSHAVSDTDNPDFPFRATALENWNTHLLTHIDAPRHRFSDGRTLDQLPLERFLGRALVIETGDARAVTPSHIPDRDLTGWAVYFKTRNSDFDPAEFREDYTFIEPETAEELRRRRVGIVGLDYLSIERYGDTTYPDHVILLKDEILIVEGLILAGIPAGEYEFSALPLKIEDADGSPIRAILIGA